MSAYDFLIVGAGLFGATFAQAATARGRRCLVIDQRDHLAGNCYTREEDGIHVHQYGPHIFHTADPKIWQYVQQFAAFNHFTYRPMVDHQGKRYSFPLNLMTLYQLWGVKTPAEAEAALAARRVPCAAPRNLKEWILAQVGEEIYETFIAGYTTKQWGRDPALLPASIIQRLPIRLTYDNNYFHDPYQGIPVGGYTAMVARMLAGVEVQLACDFFADQPRLMAQAARTVYSGPLDRYFKHRFGPLEYRSLRFEEERLTGDFQGVAAVNYTDAAVPYTRIVEHKHFTFGTQAHTIITREYPAAAGEPFYPVRDAANEAKRRQYQDLADAAPVLFGGRLGSYRYYDMHQVIAQALALARRVL